MPECKLVSTYVTKLIGLAKNGAITNSGYLSQRLRNNELRAYIHVQESGYEVVMSVCQHGDDLMSQVRTVISPRRCGKCPKNLKLGINIVR